jgi:hypothetical protein
MGDVEITVRGFFEARHAPEEAVATLAIEAEDRDEAVAYGAASRSGSAVREHVLALLDPTHGPVSWWSSDLLRTWAHRLGSDGAEASAVAYRGAMSMQVRFIDTDAMSLWFKTIANTDGVRVARIDWTLSDARQAELVERARSAAVLDAVAKARAYAHSLNLGHLRPVAIADAGMLGAEPNSPGWGPTAARYSRVDDLSVSFVAQDVTVTAAVDVRFVAA